MLQVPLEPVDLCLLHRLPRPLVLLALPVVSAGLQPKPSIWDHTVASWTLPILTEVTFWTRSYMIPSHGAAIKADCSCIAVLPFVGAAQHAILTLELCLLLFLAT